MRTRLFGVVLIVVASALRAQTPRFLDVGSETERVLRVLQLTGDVPLYPWSMRALSPAELDRLTTRDSLSRALLPPESPVRNWSGVRVEVLPLEAGVVYNSAFPYGFNDGPLWAGKGLTGSLSGGVAARLGPLSVQLEPMVFDAQNAAFPLKPTGVVGGSPFANGFAPATIDYPQRFGDRAYGRFDWGQSAVRLDVGPAMVEFSKANQWWGPAVENPLILGNNAPGFLHASVGTSRPINIGIGQLHARVVYGRLEQSAFSPDTSADSLRFMSGLVVEYVPRGIPGLEVGATRFFHSQWPGDGLSHASFGQPFEGILKKSLETAANPTGTSPDNQLASLFARWVLPQSGFEVYGEYGREDHNVDTRDLIQEPDHDAAYVLGFQRAWRRSGGERTVFRGELLNARVSHLLQGRPQTQWYVHFGSVLQGHTDLGQVLGAPSAFGGSGAVAAADMYDRHGRWTLEWTRTMRAERLSADGATPDPAGGDVLHALTVERSRKYGTSDLVARIAAVWDFNRDLGGATRFNVQGSFGLRAAW